MLVVTSVLLVAAVGLLAAALITGPIWLAWGSIAASAVAGLVLIVRWWRLRRYGGRHRATAEAAATGPKSATPPQHAPEPDTAPQEPDTAPPEPDTAQQEPDTAQQEPSPPQPGRPEPGPGAAVAAWQNREPAEEDTDAADLLLICELDDEVAVVDERPRYHLRVCRWVGTRPTEVLTVREARDLGFTPCAGCGPDAEIAARRRATNTGATS